MRHKYAAWDPFLPLLPVVCLLSKGKTPALLPDGKTSAVPFQHALHAQMKCFVSPRSRTIRCKKEEGNSDDTRREP